MLNGFFDIDNSLEYLTENGDILPNLKKLVPWEDFRKDLEFIYDHERKSNVRPHLQRKGCKGHPLTSWEKQGNRTRAKVRSRIEHVFGVIHQRAGNVILRTIGISMSEVKLGLRNIAYNMDRFCTLMLQNA